MKDLIPGRLYVVHVLPPANSHLKPEYRKQVAIYDPECFDPLERKYIWRVLDLSDPEPRIYHKDSVEVLYEAPHGMLEAVRDFHLAFNHPVSDEPVLPPKNVCDLRRKLIQEEAAETATAIVEDDLVGIADGLADLLYVVLGTALVYGIPIDRVFKRVHDANMAKLGPDGKPLYHPDGKVKKPDTWKPPVLDDLLLSDMIQCKHCLSYRTESLKDGQFSGFAICQKCNKTTSLTPPGENEKCDHDWKTLTGPNILFERCQRCGEERRAEDDYED